MEKHYSSPFKLNKNRLFAVIFFSWKEEVNKCRVICIFSFDCNIDRYNNIFRFSCVCHCGGRGGGFFSAASLQFTLSRFSECIPSHCKWGNGTKRLLCIRISYVVYVVQQPQNSSVRIRRRRGKWSSLRWIRLRLSYFHLLSHSVDFHLCKLTCVCVCGYRVYQFNSIQFWNFLTLELLLHFFFTSLNNSLGFQQVLFLYARILFDFYLGLYFFSFIFNCSKSTNILVGWWRVNSDSTSLNCGAHTSIFLFVRSFCALRITGDLKCYSQNPMGIFPLIRKEKRRIK